MKPPISLVLATLMLTACAYVVPSTIAKLANTSPLMAEPSGIAVALILPPGLKVTPGSAQLKVSIARADTGETRLGNYALVESVPSGSNITLSEGETLHVFRLSQKDVVAMRALQAALAAWEQKAVDGKGSGTLGLGVAGCATGAGPAKDAVASAYIKTEVDGTFLPLIDRKPLASLLGTDISGTIKACPKEELDR